MKKYAIAYALLAAAAVRAGAPEWVRAEVVKVEPERSRIVLNHEHIKSIDMPAMRMPFKTEKAVDLKQFKPGDQVQFTISTKEDHLVITSMKKLEKRR